MGVGTSTRPRLSSRAGRDHERTHCSYLRLAQVTTPYSKVSRATVVNSPTSLWYIDPQSAPRQLERVGHHAQAAHDFVQRVAVRGLHRPNDDLSHAATRAKAASRGQLDRDPRRAAPTAGWPR